MRTWIAGIILAAIPTFSQAGALTVYKYVDAAGRVTYTNQKPRQGEDFDTLEVEYDAPTPAVVKLPRSPSSPARTQPENVATAAPREWAAYPSLRLAALGMDAAGHVRRKPGAATAALVLRLDTALSSLER